MPIKDATKRRENHARYMREVWYPANKEKHMAAVRISSTARQQQVAINLGLYKSGKHCKYCPEADAICLDFHHREPELKERGIAEAVGNGWSWESLLKEIAKCDLVCSNCHRKLHGGRELTIYMAG